MKTLRISSFGDPARVTELLEAPAPQPGPRQVVVAMEASPINPSDLLLISGRYGHRPQLPSTLGTEGVGRISAVGDGVDARRLGDRVLVIPRLRHGTWQDRLGLDETETVPLTASADPLQMAMVGINPLTADLLLRAFVDLAPGDWVAQTAANSAVGRYVIPLAKQAGLRTLNVVRRSSASAQLTALGADAVVTTGPDMHDHIAQALGDDRPRLLLDAVAGDLITELGRWVKAGGTIVSYGALSGGTASVKPSDLIFRDLHLRGFWQKHWVENAAHADLIATYTRLAELVAAGVLHAPVAATYRLEQYAQALAHAGRHGREGKVLFAW